MHLIPLGLLIVAYVTALLYFEHKGQAIGGSLLLVVVISVVFGYEGGYYTSNKEVAPLLKECEAKLPRNQTCKLVAVPVGEK